MNITPGVHWIEDSYLNWYLLDEGGELTAVDAGLPASWESLRQAISALGRSMSDLKAIVLTHAHFDHVGFAEKARQELNIPVWVHPKEVELTHHPLTYQHERSRLWYAWRPANMAVMASFISWGMLHVQPIGQVKTYDDGQTLDVPGSPKVVFTPGHTFGHSALVLADKGVVLAGDAFVLRDPYTGHAGPRVVAKAATADSEQALHSLGRLKGIEANTVLTGHGKPWFGAVGVAAEQAQHTRVD